MRRVCKFALVLILIFGLISCSQNIEAQWQEQYDLGIRYLSEGNYEEAIIAFTASIKIDSKRVESFVGRGDAYAGMAEQYSIGKQISEQQDACESALADYLEAIALDKLYAAVYGKAADIYLALGDQEAAAAILEQGYAATGDKELLVRAEDLRKDKLDGMSEVLTLEGYLIYNPDEYRAEWDKYMDQYQDDENNVYCSIDTYGVRFLQPAVVNVNGHQVSILEALPENIDLFFDENTQLYNHETETGGPMLGHTIQLRGYFYLNNQTEEITGPVSYESNEIYYEYRPNGDYVFSITGYEEVG